MSDNLHLEELISDLGGFGRFQFALVSLYSVAMLTLVWGMMTMSFAGAIPDWWCRDDVIGQNYTTNQSHYEMCTNFNQTQCEHFEYDESMKTIVGEWDLVCDRKWITQTTTTIQMAGVLVGGFVGGHLGDSIGRKPTFYLSILTISVSNLITFFSVSWQMFTVFRFLIGLGVGGYLTVTLSFVSEFVGQKSRTVVAILPNWSFWSAAFALLAFLIHDWKWLHVAIAIASAPFLLTWWFVPESFRWLVARGRVTEAEMVVKRIAKMNGKECPDMTKIRKTIEMERDLAEKDDLSKLYTMADLFKSKALVKVTLLFGFIWVACSYSYYGIAFGVQQMSGDLYMNIFLVGMVDIPGNIAVLFINHWAGRKWTSVGFFVVSGIAALGVAVVQILPDVANKGEVINGLALTSKLGVAAAWTAVTVWTVESYPTVVRNIGYGVHITVARVGSMVAPQIITLSEDVTGLLYFLCGGFMLASAIACIFLPETKDVALTDQLEKNVQTKHKGKDTPFDSVAVSDTGNVQPGSGGEKAGMENGGSVCHL